MRLMKAFGGGRGWGREGGREGRVDACRPFEPFNINPISTIDLYKSENIVLRVSFRIIA